jgi:hypothetical protein
VIGTKNKFEEPAPDSEERFVVEGSYGRLLVDTETGKVLAYHDPSETHAYDRIVRFDVAEYVQYNGGVDPTGIELIGYWESPEGGGDVPLHRTEPSIADREARGVAITMHWHKLRKRLEGLRLEVLNSASVRLKPPWPKSEPACTVVGREGQYVVPYARVIANADDMLAMLERMFELLQHRMNLDEITKLNADVQQLYRRVCGIDT